MKFGYLLRTLRICAGLSLRELARNIDVSPTYLSLIENGKQPPPSPSRIAKIEEILKVPSGSLLSISRGFDPAVLSFLQNMPEAVDFLNAAREKQVSAAALTELTSFIYAHGEDALRQALELPVSCSSEPAACGKASCSVYVWSYLDENLVFDLGEAKDKEIFLEQAVSRICRHCNGVKPDLILDELLRREKIASTGIGHGIAVPHAYVSGLDRMIVAFIRTPGGLDFQSVDGEPVQMALLLAGPRSSKNLHLLLLSRIARLVRNQSFCRRVIGAENAAKIISVFREMETAVP